MNINNVDVWISEFKNEVKIKFYTRDMLEKIISKYITIGYELKMTTMEMFDHYSISYPGIIDDVNSDMPRDKLIELFSEQLSNFPNAV